MPKPNLLMMEELLQQLARRIQRLEDEHGRVSGDLRHHLLVHERAREHAKMRKRNSDARRI